MSGNIEKSWHALFKFGKRAHIEEFRSGKLYMSPQKYFRDLESDPVRADQFETVDRVHQPDEIRCIRINDHEKGTETIIPEQFIVGPLLIGFGRVCYNLFCMYGASEFTETGLFVDPQNFKFRRFVHCGARDARILGSCVCRRRRYRVRCQI